MHDSKTAETLLFEIHRIIVGNGQPGLLHRVTVLEQRRTAKARPAAFRFSIISAIATAVSNLLHVPIVQHVSIGAFLLAMAIWILLEREHG